MSVIPTTVSQKHIDFVAEIKRFANDNDNYTNGWDVVVETLSDRQIAVLCFKARTLDGALSFVRGWVKTDPKILDCLPEGFYEMPHMRNGEFDKLIVGEPLLTGTPVEENVQTDTVEELAAAKETAKPKRTRKAKTTPGPKELEALLP
jgi:hypothetical protein